jgi:hypothetical protein
VGRSGCHDFNRDEWRRAALVADFQPFSSDGYDASRNKMEHADSVRALQTRTVMETRLTLRPGMPGTKKLVARFGARLVCVRYLYDEARGRRLKTVELVVEEAPWNARPRMPRRQGHDMVGVRIGYDETELRIAVKKAGGIWRPRQKLWEISWESIRALGIGHRVVSG